MNERFTRNPDGGVTLTREVTITVASGTSMFDAETECQRCAVLDVKF
jgi:hypothetical protein